MTDEDKADPSLMDAITALQDIALLDEADGHELTVAHAHRAVAIATRTLGKHPSKIHAERRAGMVCAHPPSLRWCGYCGWSYFDDEQRR